MGNRETWREWMPPDCPLPAIAELIGRDELLRRVRNCGADVSPRTLGFLEQHGMTPRPVRQWHDGATRALYPPWAVDLVLQTYGHKWARRRRALTPRERQHAVKEAMRIPALDALRPEYV